MKPRLHGTPFHFRRTPIAAALIAGFSAPLAFAAEPAATQTTSTLPEVRVEETRESDFTTEETRGATRTDTPLRDIPQFINTVPQELIRSQNATTLQEALRNVPGISYAAPEGGTQVNQVFFLRGFPIFGDLFVDGVRDLGEYNRDLFATESVEVLKGPSALMFGRGSTGGLINQISKVANREALSDFSYTGGSEDQKRATADVNTLLGPDLAFRVAGVWEDSGNYRYEQDVKKKGFAPSFLASLGEQTQATLSYYYLNEHSVTDYGQPALFINQGKGTFLGFADVSPKKYYGFADDDYSHYSTRIATLTVDHQFSDSLTLRNTTRWASYERNMEATITEGIRPNDVNGNPVTAATPQELILVTRNHDTNRSRDNNDDALINQTELTWQTNTGSIEHTLLTGLELARETLDRNTNLLDANPNLTGAQAPLVISPILAPDIHASLSYTKIENQRARADGDTVGLYVQDQIEFTEQWKALVGLRDEWYKGEAKLEALPGGTPVAANAGGPFRRSEYMLSGRVGVIWQPTPTQSYYISWGNSYNPSGELGIGDSPRGAGGAVAQTNLNAINEHEGPEENQNYEVGAQWDIGTVQVRSAVFRNEKTNGRQLDPTGTTTVLDGERRVDGIEFEVTGALTPNWDVYTGIAFMNGKIVSSSPNGGLTNTDGSPTGPITDITEFCARTTTRCLNIDGNDPAEVPEVAGSLWTVYRLPYGFEVAGGLRGQRGAWLTDRNDPGSQIPDYVLLDASIAFVQPHYQVQVNGYNLTDKTYYIGGYNNRPDRVLPGQGSSVSVTVRYNFN